MQQTLLFPIFCLLILLFGRCTLLKKDKMEPELYFDGVALKLAKAIQANDIEQIDHLSDTTLLNAFYREEMTLLIWAMMLDKEKAFYELLKLGADPNLRSSKNVQSVALAAGISDDNKYLKILLKYGGSPDSWQGAKPATHKAFDRMYFKNVDILLNAGADINLKDADGLTLLNSAGYLRWFDKAIKLIERGADISIPTQNGGTVAFHVQNHATNIGSDTYKDQAKLRKMLVERGVKFPILHPARRRYVPLLNQWYRTSEGQQWQQRLQAIADDSMGFGKVWVEADDAAKAAFKAWMKKNNIPEPPQNE